MTGLCSIQAKKGINRLRMTDSIYWKVNLTCLVFSPLKKKMQCSFILKSLSGDWSLIWNSKSYYTRCDLFIQNTTYTLILRTAHFSDAFNTVSHSILLNKMLSIQLGMYTIWWVNNWRKYQAQIVAVSGVTSGWCSATLSLRADSLQCFYQCPGHRSWLHTKQACQWYWIRRIHWLPRG